MDGEGKRTTSGTHVLSLVSSPVGYSASRSTTVITVCSVIYSLLPSGREVSIWFCSQMVEGDGVEDKVIGLPIIFIASSNEVSPSRHVYDGVPSSRRGSRATNSRSGDVASYLTIRGVYRFATTVHSIGCIHSRDPNTIIADGYQVMRDGSNRSDSVTSEVPAI